MTFLSRLIPIPPALKPESSVFELKQRLDWGEPAFTIVDVSHRDVFNQRHITGAISMPVDSLVKRALESLESDRDIYVYGGTDAETAIAVAHLREAGFNQVAQLRGGLEAWQAAGYPAERFDLEAH